MKTKYENFYTSKKNGIQPTISISTTKHPIAMSIIEEKEKQESCTTMDFSFRENVMMMITMNYISLHFTTSPQEEMIRTIYRY